MRTRTFFYLFALMMTACAPQPAITNTPFALQPGITNTPPAPATDTPTVAIASATSTVATLALPTFTPTNVVPPTAVFTSTPLPPVTGVYNPYVVILVSAGDVLNIRSGAGVGNDIVGALQPKSSGVNRTGPATSVGGDRWVEIQNPRGGVGWVNANFLTEHIPSSTFCSDARVTSLLNNLKTALLTLNGEALSSLVSPVHGLDLRLWRYGTSANYSPEEAAWVFLSDYVVNWGPAPGSGEETFGSFSAQPLPKLQEAFGANYSLHCNDTLDLATFSLEPWPPEYDNVNFYTVYKPGTEQYGGLDWRAWVAGVEYVQGKPTLFALIHFQWEP